MIDPHNPDLVEGVTVSRHLPGAAQPADHWGFRRLVLGVARGEH